MDDIITYIVVFGLILIGIIIWQFRYAKPRPFWLSFQIYPDLKLWVQVEKKDGKHKSLIIRCEIKPENYIKLPYIELIDKKREKIKIEIPKETEGIIEKTKNKHHIYFKLDFIEFSNLLKNNDYKFSTFRICVEYKTTQVFKSHELAFDKKWTIFKPDSGTYN